MRFTDLISECGKGQTFAYELAHNHVEAISIVHWVVLGGAIVEAKYLLIDIPAKVERLDSVIGPMQTALEQRPKVLKAVSVYATLYVLTIGKAYSGLTDVEIEELTEHFTTTTIARHGRYREVSPEIVLEIAFDSIQPSDRHASGLAMRFPRIKGIRRDKTPAQIDTLAHARRLVAERSISAEVT